MVLNFDLGGICTDNEKDFKRLGVTVEPMRIAPATPRTAP